MRLILPERNLPALRSRVEQRFKITLAGHWSEMRGGSYLRWSGTHRSLATRMRLKLKPESPPFKLLLMFRNSAVDDSVPYYEGYDSDCILVELEGDAEGATAHWFMANEAATPV